MLSQQEIDLLCRVGPGTAMGALMRQYWLPVIYSWELEPDGEPQRVRVLGENLIAYRDSNGAPGFIGESCPHRGASLFFGRNEEAGLRCVYHGWKFDTTGACVDMPNEPAESNFKHKIKATAYRAAEAGRLIWIYMGPRQDDPPGVPQWEWCTLPENQLQHGHKGVYECNWMQALEGELDSSHAPFLHSRLRAEDPGTYGGWTKDLTPRLETVDTDQGVLYGARRVEDEDHYYWRTTQFVFPIYGMFPGGGDDGTVPLSIYMPIDDTHTLHMGLRYHPTQALPGDGRPHHVPFKESGELVPGLGPNKPEQKGRMYSHWWTEADKTNDFMLNRKAQRTVTYSGIGAGRLQDTAMIVSMGPIMDRTVEHLGTSDTTIIRVRRRLMQAAIALRDQGTVPPLVEKPEGYRVRSCMAILPKADSWTDRLRDWHYAVGFEHPTGGYKTPAPGVADHPAAVVWKS